MPSDQPPNEGKANLTLPSVTLRGTGAIVDLGRAASDEVGQIGQQTPPDRGHELALREEARRDAAAELRRWLAEKVVPSFLWANGAALLAIALLAAVDEVNICLHLITPADRIITGQVMMSLLGATTVQVGAIAAIIARSLFPSRRE